MNGTQPVETPAPPLGKMNSIEGIRGLAALMLLFGNLIAGFYPELARPSEEQMVGHSYAVELAATTPLRVVWDGQWAISIFCVLSGFVVALAFFRFGGTEATTSTAIRRYFRLIIPATASVFLAYFLMKCGCMFNREAADCLEAYRSGHGAWFRLLYDFQPIFRNAFKEGSWSMFLGQTTYNPSLGTMTLALQGGFVICAFVTLFGRIRHRWVVYLAGSLVLVLSNNLALWQFLLGAALADVYVADEIRQSGFRLPFWVSLPAAVGAIYLATLQTSSPLSLTWVVLDRNAFYQAVASFLLVGAVIFSPLLRRIQEMALLRFLGKISFSLYLVHLPLLCSVGCGLYLLARQSFGWSHTVGVTLAAGGTVGAAVLVAWAFYHWVDRPSVWLCKLVYANVFVNRPTVAAGPALVIPPDDVSRAA